MEVILTSHRYGERELLEQLRELGDFYQTRFMDVIRGRVENCEDFLQNLERRSIFTLSRVVPIEKSFNFSPQSVVEEFVKLLSLCSRKFGKASLSVL